MNTLYELDNNFNAVLSMVYDEDVDLDMLEDTLQAIEAALETKVQNGIGLFRELEKERNGLKAEIERLTKKLKRIDGSIERLKTYYQAHLESMAKDAVKTPIGTMKICLNPPTVVIDDETKLPPQYFRIIPETREPDKKNILQALKSGADIPGVHLEQKRRLDIK